MSTRRALLLPMALLALGLGCGAGSKPAGGVAADASPADAGDGQAAGDADGDASGDGGASDGSAPDGDDDADGSHADVVSADDSEDGDGGDGDSNDSDDSDDDSDDDAGAPDAGVAPATCSAPADCADEPEAGPCRAWACVDAVCALVPAAAGSPCASANGCLQPTCDGDGACAAVVLAACPGTVCAPGICDAISGACSSAPATKATACDDGDACTSGDGCDGQGACVPGLPLACTASACEAPACDAKAGCLVPLPLPVGATCSDGDACTVGDGCDGKGGCTAGAPLVCAQGSCVGGSCPPPADTCDAKACDDGNVCTLDGCAPDGGCTAVALAAGPCDDGDACSGPDLCAGGACQAGPAKVCADAGPCAQVACAPASGACLALPLPGPCTASDACLVGASCQDGACQGGAPLGCDDGKPCTADACAQGVCSHLPLAPGASCGVGLACGAGATCGCALGSFVAPHQGQEWLRAVAPLADGFVAVGDSDGPGSARGLLLRVDHGNSITLQRRYGGVGKVSFAAVAPAAPGLVVAATLGGPHAALLRFDALGNVQQQAIVALSAVAQALVADGKGGFVVLTTDDFGPGASTRVVRVDTAFATTWARVLAPASAFAAARAHDLVLDGTSLLVAGQDIAAATGAPGACWLRSVGLDGVLAPTTWSPPTPTGGVILAAARRPGALVLAGTVLTAGGGFGKRWTVQTAWPAATLAGVPALDDGGAFAGASAAGDVVMLAGWNAVAGGQAVLRALDAKGVAFDVALPAASPQALHALTPLGDGSVVAVGSRDLPDGSAGVWVRMRQDGTLACP